MRPALAAFADVSAGVGGPSVLLAFNGLVSLPFLPPSASVPSWVARVASGSVLFFYRMTFFVLLTAFRAVPVFWSFRGGVEGGW